MPSARPGRSSRKSSPCTPTPWPRSCRAPDAGTLLGHSQIAVPFKGVLQRCNHNREAMLVQSVDTALLADAETAYAIRQDLKMGLSLDA